jgi:hypothetical protein
MWGDRPLDAGTLHEVDNTQEGIPEQASAEQDNFDLAAAGLRLDSADLAMSVQVLAAKLEQALPGQARVERSGGGLLGRGEKHVRRVKVEVGSCAYELAVDGARVQGSRVRQSGGIAIKRESLDPDAWIAALTADLRVEAERSAQARAALEKLLR